MSDYIYKVTNKKQNRKIISILLIPVYICLLLLSGDTTISAAEEKSVDLISVTITDHEGNPLGEEVDRDEDIIVTYFFEIPDEISGGDYAYIYLPDEIDIIETNLLIEVYLAGYEGQEEYRILTAEYDSASHRLVLNFDSITDEYDDLTAYLTFEGSFDAEEIGNGGSREISLGTDRDGNEIVIVVDFEESEVTAEKEAGAVYYSNEDEAYIVEWSITIDPDNTELTNVMIQDKLPAGFQYVPGSASYQPAEYGTELQMINNGDTLVWNAEGPLNTAFTITFLTAAEDLSILDYEYDSNGMIYFPVENGIEMTYKTETGIWNTGSSSTTEIKPELLYKGGEYNYDTKTIFWELILNKDEMSIPNAVLTDYIPAGLHFDVDSIEIWQMQDGVFVPRKLSDIAEVAVTEVTNEQGDAQTKVVFAFLDTLDACYKIEYATQVENDDFFLTNGSQNYENYAILTGGRLPGPGIGSKIPVTAYSRMLTKSVYRNYNSDTQQVEWIVGANQNLNDLTGKKVEIRDTIDTAIHEYVEGSLIVREYGADGVVRETDSDAYTVDYTEGVLSIVFPDGFGELALAIQFSTQVTNMELLVQNASNIRIPNSVELFINDESIATAQANTTFNPEILNKSHIDTNYEERSISWRLRINRYGTELPGTSVVTDTLPEGLALKAAYYEDQNGSMIGEVLVQGSDYHYDESTRKITFEFYDLNSPVYVRIVAEITDSYLTDVLMEQNADSQFTNKAMIHTDANPNHDTTVTNHVTYKNTLVGKTGAYDQDEQTIAWEILINSNALDWELGGAVLSDQLQEGLELDTSSVMLTRNRLKADGSLEELENYELTGENIAYDAESGLFIFTFPEVGDGYVYLLSFQTFVMQSGSYSNSITLEGISQGSGSSGDMQITIGGAGGGAAGTSRKTSFEISKTDRETGEALEGVSFRIKDKYGNYLGTSVTDSTGTASFSNIVYGEIYTIEETAVPEGYVLLEEPFTICITKDTQAGTITVTLTGEAYIDGEQEIILEIGTGVTVSVENRIIKGSVEIIKKDSASGEVLAGAVFQLTSLKDSSVVYQAEPTDKTGKTVISDVPYGSYLLTEIASPDGYHRSADERIIEITKDGEKIELDFADDIFNFSLKKQNESGDVLSSAFFTLEQQQEEEWVTIRKDIQLKSDEQGIVTLNGLDIGTYRLTETKAPAGYLIQEEAVIFSVSRDSEGILAAYDAENIQYTEAHPFVFVNYKAQIRFMKVDADGTGISSGDAVFGLYYDWELSNPVTDENGEAVTAQTDEEGLVIFDYISPGTYYIAELQAPEGYIRNTQVNIAKVPEKGSGTVIVNTESVINYKGSVMLMKINGMHTAEETEEMLLDHAYFRLDKLLEGETGEPVEDEDGSYVTEAEIADELISENGIIIVESLSPGLYQFTETQAPEGFIRNTASVIFRIEDEAEGAPEMLMLGYFENYQGQIAFYKEDATGEPLEGAEFAIYQLIRNEEEGEAEEVLISGKLVSDEDGLVFYEEGLAPGEYVVYETKAPEGYLRNTEIVLHFEIEAEQEGLPAIMELGTFANYKQSIRLIKTNEQEEKLAGATFMLKKIASDDEAVIIADALITDEEGELFVEELAPGIYELTETKAPAGYLLDETPIRFVVEDEAEGEPETIELEMINYEIPEEEETEGVPGTGIQTGDATQYAIWLLLLVFAGGFIGVYIKKRR